MADNVVFEDYSVRVKEVLKEKAISFLYEVGGELVSMIQRNSRRDTSQTAGSYEYKVDDSQLAVHIGSNYENAIWEEFGTGVYALNGDGRTDSWKYQDRNGRWHTTKGKKANRPMIKSYTTSRSRIEKRVQDIFKD